MKITDLQAYAGRIKMAAFDLDGTLLDPSSHITRRTYAALEAAGRCGICLVCASGRPFSALSREVLDIPGLNYVVTLNGVRIHEMASGQDICVRRISDAAIRQVLDLTKTWPVAREFYLNGQAFADADYVADATLYGADKAGAEYVRRTRLPIRDMDSFLRQHAGQIDSMSLSRSEDMPPALDLCHQLQEAVADVYVTSSTPRLVEIAQAQAGKRSALEFLLERERIDPTYLAAFGDADNDLGMIRLAGLGVAMAGGARHLREAADLVCPSNAEDGVAQVLEGVTVCGA